MAMTTRCPHCAAVFRVVPDQLRVRSGLVRCGACGSVFDGYAGLVSDEEAAEPVRRNPPAVFRNRADMLREQPEDGSLPADEDDERWDPNEEPDAGGDGPFAREDRRLAATGPGPVRDETAVRQPTAEEAGEPESPGPEPVLSAAPLYSDEAFKPWYGGDDAADGRDAPVPSGIMGEHRGGADAPVPEFLDEDLQRRRRLRNRLLAIAAAVALLVLAVQLLLVYRTSIAAALPAVRPVLSLLCQPLGCSVGYERRAERISIMSSSLQPDGERAAANATASGSVAGGKGAGRLVLNVVLRNRYDGPQPWPALMLDLRDVSDTVVVRKVLLPQDYLPAGVAAQPFGAGAEISLAVPLQVGVANVNGYQIDKFFP